MLNIGNRIVNNWLYPIENGYVLVDTGYEGGFQRFCQQIEKRGISLLEIKYLFLTHAHDDHAGFLNEILAAHKELCVVMHPDALPRLLIGQNSFDGGCSTFQAYLFCQLMRLLGKGEHKFPPISKDFENRCVLIDSSNIAEIEAMLQGTIIFTPGHTKDSISLLSNDGNLFCGDAAMSGFPSKHNITIWLEDKVGYYNSWCSIIELKPKRIFPSHGKPFHHNRLNVNISYLNHIKLHPLK